MLETACWRPFIWGVFHYFFPYKDLMGEDWDAALREFIPRMEAADDASQYRWAVAEMVPTFMIRT